MNHDLALKHEFVEFIPEDLGEGVVYISIRFATASHLCCCGCGTKVVTPITPTDWKLIFDGKTISLDPSIGNWSFACRSHYWIWNNRVQWAPRWSDKQIERGRSHDRIAKQEYFHGDSIAKDSEAESAAIGPIADKRNRTLWQALKSFWR
jgi:hypothetical protein